MKKLYLLLFIILMLSCSKGPSHKDTITLSGAFAIYPSAVEWGNEFQKLYPQIKVEVSAGGAGKGIADCIGGLVDIGMVSREPDQKEIEQGIDVIPISHDGVFIIVPGKNPFSIKLLEKGIKRETLKGLYIEGKRVTFPSITNQPSNQEAFINIYTRSDSCGSAATFAKFLGGYKQENLMGIGVNSDPQMINAVLNDINGISYTNFSYVFDKKGKIYEWLKIIPIDINENGIVDEEEKIENLEDAKRVISNNIYPISRTNYFFIKKGVRENVKKFITFCLSEEGTKVIENVGTTIPLSKDLRKKIIFGLK